MASTHTSYVLAKLALHITRTPRVEETITVQTEPEALHRAVNRPLYHLLRCTGQGRSVCGQPLVLIDTEQADDPAQAPGRFPHNGLGG